MPTRSATRTSLVRSALPALPLLALALAAPGCVLEAAGPPPPAGGPPCQTAPYTIDTGYMLTYRPGVDAGYYLEYLGGGHWHLEWTCDTQVSSYGCAFSGAVWLTNATGAYDAPSNVTCYQCEPGDWAGATTDSAGNPVAEFTTDTSVGVDGLDFDAPIGDQARLELQIDDTEHPELVFFASGAMPQSASSPACVPFTLVASSS